MNVKICGITSEADARMVLEAGADAIGVIVDVPVDTPRKVTMQKAQDIRRSIDDLSPAFIAVLMPKTVEEVVSACDKLTPTGVQLHGDERPEFIAKLRESIDCPIIKAIHVDANLDYGYVIQAAKNSDMLLLDTKSRGKAGGTGETHDYEIDKKIKAQTNKRIMLSGGLNASNVEYAVEAVGPYAVDVSSGVESSPGVKDPVKVRDFIEVTRCL